MTRVRTLACLVSATMITSALALPGVASAVRIINVSTASQLTAALQNALPGDEIRMADGTYAGRFIISRSGTAAAPIVLTGSRAAVINGGGTGSGRIVQLQADNWRLVGFTVTNGQKGIMALGAHNTIIDGVRVHHIGDEAIHFRDASTDNTVQNSDVSDTGLREPGFGEGLYFGQAVSNWVNGQPDRSDRNKAINNKIGPNVRAESLDIKEGTTGGEVRGNTFDGAGMTGANFADSWLDVKGNGYRITGNRGTTALLDGYQTHVAVSGWGNNNVFNGNTVDVRASGFGFNINRSTTGNVVCSNNIVTNAGSGAANVPLTNCGGAGPSEVEVTPAASGVTASGNDGNVPGNTVDNDTATRWSASGDGQWIRFDLGTSRTITRVAIAVYQGNTRHNSFDLQVSGDGASWQTVFSGQSGGTSAAQEAFDFTDTAARFVRYLGHGSDVNAWNSLTEVDIFALSS
jgi:F5/8 type C domain/Right handed beta helix region